MVTEVQLTLDDLLPKARLAFAERRIPLAELPADGELVGPEPGPDLVESLGRLGLLQPVLLVEVAPRRYEVLDGRRRIRAARQAGLTEVSAWVLASEGGALPVVALTANEQRRPNDLVAFRAICALRARGADDRLISRATGLSVQTIRRISRLDSLHPTLRLAMEEGRLGISVAERAMRYPEDLQATLAQRYLAEGKLSMQDVIEARRVAGAAIVAALPDALFAGPPASDPLRDAIGQEWREMHRLRRSGDRAEVRVRRHCLRRLLALRRALGR